MLQTSYVLFCDFCGNAKYVVYVRYTISSVDHPIWVLSVFEQSARTATKCERSLINAMVQMSVVH